MIFTILLASWIAGTLAALLFRLALLGDWKRSYELWRGDRALCALQLRRAWAYLVRRLVYQTSHCSERAKCPGCGHRRNRITFDEALKLIVHTCLICGARWGEKPVVDTAAWIAEG